MKVPEWSFPGVESLKALGFKSMLWLLIATLAMKFAPQSWLAALHLDQWATQESALIGLGLIIACAFFASLLANFLLDEAISYLGTKRKKEVIEHKVKLLDPAERALLREFFLQGKTILTLPVEELAVRSLVDTNILECLGNVKHYAIQGSTADYKISMLAREHLNRNVLRLPNGELSQEDMQNLIKARPGFVGNVVSHRKPPQRAA
ncbi:superinfection exclusion B family protein [Shewanella litorisediminis]|uniref:Superinfection exclusion B family protein n=1 Tax=Shewanella litorisediminis TaxID=1173586 RepID=A0ABX7G505_9GAMM|nr:superinfection exclusion B family protein [Shewanella litorisediminis]MCL2917893.1 superinfection exclusion B family protein [Shewanella litorisediminis]QRH02328.1 superinfection exclusion B family protein [Shewanella litorisediminis]